MKSGIRIAAVFFIVFSVMTSSTAPEIIEKRVGDISLVYVPAGTFSMGRNSDNKDYSPSRKVSISKGFWIGRFEITQKQYMDITGLTPCADSRYGSGDDLPVYNVSWYDAVEFCNLLSLKYGLKPYYEIDKDDRDSRNISVSDDLKWDVEINKKADGFRLPTEAQWEYACMGTKRSDFYWGDSQSWDVSGKYAWHMFNAGQKKYSEGRFWWVKYHKVKTPGQKKANQYGIYDISGNVAEWCYDRYSASYYSSGGNADPSGADGDFTYRVVRGGSMLDAPKDLASYKRWPVEPFERIGTNGIRVVLPE